MKNYIDKFIKGNIRLNIKGSLSSNHLYIDEVINEDYKRYKGIKFVPASGDATRMFQDLYQFLNDDVMSDRMKEFFGNLHNFTFLNNVNLSSYNFDNKDDRVKLINEILYGKLNLSKCPKGLIKIHNYNESTTTAFEEHLYESQILFNDKEINVHFTISENHIDSFNNALREFKNEHNNSKFNVSFSFQDKSTDTLAVDIDNSPFIKEDGEYLYRAGGHGSLISNLNKLDADLIFISNIDNVCHRDSIKDSIDAKKKLASIGVKVKNKIDKYIRDINNNDFNIERVSRFLSKELNILTKDGLTKDEALKFLNRPLRVVGVVKNVGEPGGGPYFVDNGDYIDVQICEKAELDLSDENVYHIFQSSEYFNPVNLVCFVKDYEGNKFDLKNYINHDRYFISEKSYNGTPIKALEHPGLWNGAMHYWNSVYVEIPLSTFNPIKTVFDLLRDGHQKKVKL